ncbi:formate/nitrite transporter family protein [Aneurinibacillus migulanus]|uniref:Formate/nitrite transporter n=1 Tax=Aneurinibacillus migulanus TaxID=47500 RepID=A0A0D1WIR4_ANEMI|nr:formate/nitrite transporter family protein [Aneurinibacillus migulanus]KIV58460.1 formate/nitrite transporter [Aneurinibacillus migulanus]KON90855.1 formate/nitrite transporter [Aneurinibacillus migulanus]MED0890690.1 formate/nitrite transporter family protein [Aneurinibacillus migulanus]MED1617130.1 formate/nitrite transporter family protein [Aneurinibacillus migulanus]MED4731356.1 formate/nitrite transporter family protein [Aneurinibacillus migulanus]
MAFHPPQQIARTAVEMGTKKANMSLSNMLVLGFLAGAFIALGFLLDIRTIGNLPKEWGSFGSFLGGAVFPLGLILVIMAGGELLTGNMMTLPIAMMARRVTVGQIVRNWFWITIGNFIGAVFVAYFFGHVVGLTEAGPFLAKTVAIAEAKLHDTFLQAFISGIGCNWLVCLGVWLAFGADDIASKILGIWFPVMAFVTIGFQHVVANMFVIPAAIFAGKVTWMEYLSNFVPVFLGNAVGGALFVASVYWFAYLREEKKVVVQHNYDALKKNA